jgi:hypothetical protein
MLLFEYNRNEQQKEEKNKKNKKDGYTVGGIKSSKKFHGAKCNNNCPRKNII